MAKVVYPVTKELKKAVADIARTTEHPELKWLYDVMTEYVCEEEHGGVMTKRELKIAGSVLQELYLYAKGYVEHR